MRLHIARCTVRYTDYGHLLETEQGIQWLDSDGYPLKGGFELATLDAKIEEMARFVGLLDGNNEALELVVHPDITRTFDMNPRGLM